MEFAYCLGDDVRFGEVFFRKGKSYAVRRIHDLVLVYGEKSVLCFEGEAIWQHFRLFHWKSQGKSEEKKALTS